MLFSVHLTVILWAFLKVITGFFTLSRCSIFKVLRTFKACLLSSFEVAHLSSARAIILRCFDFVKHFLKVFQKVFSAFKIKTEQHFWLLSECWLSTSVRSTLFHRLCFLLSASPLSATVDIISALPSFVNPFLTIFLSFLLYRQILHFKLTCCLFYPKIHYIHPFFKNTLFDRFSKQFSWQRMDIYI